MNLGELIDTLATLPKTLRVRFDFGAVPTHLVSWRGSYDELTLDSDHDAPEPTVAVLLRDARRADGGTFHGYKGGDFTMDRHTPVWADPWGEYLSRAITGIRVSEGVVVLQTADISAYR